MPEYNDVEIYSAIERLNKGFDLNETERRIIYAYICDLQEKLNACTCEDSGQ